MGISTIHAALQYIKNKKIYIFFGVIFSVLLLHIVTYVRDPLWFDEVWRAYGVSSFKLFEVEHGSAPVPVGSFLLAKLFTLVWDTEITQRLTSVIATFLLVYVVYWFGCKIRSRNFGLLLAATVPFLPVVMDYSTQNKAFVIECVVTVILTYAFYLHSVKKISTSRLIILSCAGFFFSMSAIWLIAGYGLWGLVGMYKTKKLDKNFLVWAGITGAFSLIYYLLLIKPQMGGGLESYWLQESWKGRTAWQVVRYIAKNVIHTFQTMVIPTADLDLGKYGFIVDDWVWIPALVLLGYGTYKLHKNKLTIIPFILFVTYALTFIAAYFAMWTFGDNRINTFQFVLASIIILYGLYEVVAYLWKRRNKFKYGAALVLIILVSVLFYSLPYIALKDAKRLRVITFVDKSATHSGHGRYLDDMQRLGRELREQIKDGDTVVSLHFMTKKSLVYYYQYYDGYGNLKPAHPDYIVETRDQIPLPDLYRQLHEDKQQTVWIIMGYGYGKDPSAEAAPYYSVAKSVDGGTVKYFKLVAQ